MLALSQVGICRPPPLSFAPIFRKDAQCAESNEFFSHFYFSSYCENSKKIGCRTLLLASNSTLTFMCQLLFFYLEKKFQKII